MFADHPNKEKIKFILTPIIKEGLNASNDLTHSVEYLSSLFGDHNKKKNLDITFDFSMMRSGVFGDFKIWNANVLTELESV